MYSTTEICGSADLLRRFIHQAAGGFEAARHPQQSLNAGTTASLSEAGLRGEGPTAVTVERSGHSMAAIDAGQHQLSDLWLHRTPVVGWHHRPLSAAARSAAVHQPIPMRPVVPVAGLHMAHPVPGPCLAPAAAPLALADLTNRQHAVDPSEPEMDYGSEDDGTDALHAHCGGSRSDVHHLSLRRFSSAGVSSAFSADVSEHALGHADMPVLCSLRTLSSQDSAWSSLLPRCAAPCCQLAYKCSSLIRASKSLRLIMHPCSLDAGGEDFRVCAPCMHWKRRGQRWERCVHPGKGGGRATSQRGRQKRWGQSGTRSSRRRRARLPMMSQRRLCSRSLRWPHSCCCTRSSSQRGPCSCGGRAGGQSCQPRRALRQAAALLLLRGRACQRLPGSRGSDIPSCCASHCIGGLHSSGSCTPCCMLPPMSGTTQACAVLAELLVRHRHGAGARVSRVLSAVHAAAGVRGLRHDADAAVAPVRGRDVLQRLRPAPQARGWRLCAHEPARQVCSLYPRSHRMSKILAAGRAE